MAIKKLIEVALPLEAINAESEREKSLRHGHPSSLHLWWARRPLAAARAVIWSSLIDDPSSHPELFPTEEDQNKERKRLFGVLSELVKWENSNDEHVLEQARIEIQKNVGANLPSLLDPFAGGGAIPLEAQRLGLKAYAHDLNPVAVMINKAMIEIPARFSGVSPVNPSARNQLGYKLYGSNNNGLSKDVDYYSNLMKEEAFKRIGHLFPTAKVSDESGEREATVVAWIWAKTVQCPNPLCRWQIPLMSTYVLSKKKGHEAWVSPVYNDSEITFEVKKGLFDKELENGTKQGKKAVFCCPKCKNGIVDGAYIDLEAEQGKLGEIPVAVVIETPKGKDYIPVDRTDYRNTEKKINEYYTSHSIEEKLCHSKCRGTFASNAQGRRYGMFEYKDYFTKRQQIAFVTLTELVPEIQEIVRKDAVEAGMIDEHMSLSDEGNDATAYGEAIGVYLAFLVDQLTNQSSAINGWNNINQQMISLYSRQGIAMTWDHAECNIFSNSTGSFNSLQNRLVKAFEALGHGIQGTAKQHDAQSDCGLRNVMISTDPPYYDNICYSDLSDFFYVWMRQSLQKTYPELFSTMLVPKAEELIASPYRHDGDKEKAKIFFEDGMLKACKQLYLYACDDIPVTIYYAYKQSESDAKTGSVSSSGWETILSSIIRAGFSITGTWPIRTETVAKLKANVNALSSSIVLVCRKRPKDSPMITRRAFISELKKELRPALQKLQNSNIAPVDLAQSAIGPGMGIFSKYNEVLEADGSPMTVRSALQIINQELDMFFNEQEGELDRESRFCVNLYAQYAYNDIKFGEADTLARAKNTSVASLEARGILFAQKGIVRLRERTEIPMRVNPTENVIWLLTQQLTRAMETGGIKACAEIVSPMFGSNAEFAKDLAYRLYTIAERKGWAQEAYVYNSLVIAWPDIVSAAADLKTRHAQLTIDDMVFGGDENE